MSNEVLLVMRWPTRLAEEVLRVNGWRESDRPFEGGRWRCDGERHAYDVARAFERITHELLMDEIDP